MAWSKHKRPLECSTSCGEEGGQPQSKRLAPSASNLQNHDIKGTPGYFSLDDIREVVREEIEQANSNPTALIQSHIQNALKGLIIPEIVSLLKNAIRELVREEIEQANSNPTALIQSHIQNALKGLIIPEIVPLLKNAIRELVCKAMDHANPHSFELVQRTLPESTQITDTRNMQLHFTSRLSLPLFTGLPLQGEDGPIQIKLIDANTGMVVTSGAESSAKLDVVVLKGDFNRDDCDTWSVTEFEQYMVKEREERGPLLAGKPQVKLKEGTGELGNLKFTDNSSWTNSKKFRIGVKVASVSCEGIRVREAITEAFTVKEYRGKEYEKRNEPASDDEIWRLEKIAKGGKFCQRLNNAGICTVQEFVRHLVRDSKKLRSILGKGMKGARWNALINHANKCVPDGKSYVYHCDDKKDYGVVISNICQLKGLITGRIYQTADQLSDSQKARADNLVKAASKNWILVREFSPESFSSPMLSQSLSACPGELPMNFQSSVPVSRGLTVGLPNVNHNHSVDVALQSSNMPHDTSLTPGIQELNVSPWNQQEILPNENIICTEPHEFSNLFINSPSLCTTEDLLLSSAFDNLGGDILPENVDMWNIHDNTGIRSSSNLCLGRNLPIGKGRGVVGWFMVKAIFKWGFFGRRRVNERFVELD